MTITDCVYNCDSSQRKIDLAALCWHNLPIIDEESLMLKNDTFSAACVLAAIYYLMRHWSPARAAGSSDLALAGVALGLAIGTKINAVFWLVLLGSVHAALSWRGQRGQGGGEGTRPRSDRMGRFGLDVALVGGPVAIFGGSWIARTWVEYGGNPSPEKWKLSWGNTIYQLHHLPLPAKQSIEAHGLHRLLGGVGTGTYPAHLHPSLCSPVPSPCSQLPAPPASCSHFLSI